MEQTLVANQTVVERLDGAAWRGRPATALALGVAWGGFHLGAAFIAASVVATVIDRPRGWLPSIVWFLGLCVVASGVLQVTQRLGRRLLPLRTLLSLSLAFPGTAPSRFAIALRAGNPRLLERRVREATEHGLPSDPDAGAVALLELVAALSRHDPALRGHSERVRAYSELIAEEFGLDRAARDGLRWAGLMHDVGKLGIPSTVLNKPGPLDAAEWELIRQHPDIGAALCEPLEPWLGEWAAAVRDHHERWDGGGYPRGEAGADISIGGRVVAVADAFDVMTSARSYQRPRPVSQALQELERCSGGQFDPNVVRAFLNISIRKLRRGVGPFAAIAGGLVGDRRWRKVAETGGTAALGVTIAAIAGLLIAPFAPTTSPGASTRPSSARSSGDAAVPSGGASGAFGAFGAASSGGGGGGDTTTGARRPGVLGSSTAGRGAGADVGAAPTTDPIGGDGNAPTPSGPEGGDGSAPEPSDPEGDGGGDGGSAPPPSGGRRVGITVDPEAGSVSLDGVGSAQTPNVTVVELPATGDTVCSETGVCDPVTVSVPVPLS